jgi:hypothetical protein
MPKMRKKGLEHPKATNPANAPDSLENAMQRFARNMAAETPLFPATMERVDGQANYIVEAGNCRCFLHSAYDRAHEIRELFRDVSPETQILILYGFGLGDAVVWAGENLSELERVIVIEPSPQLIATALKYPGVVDKLKKVPIVDFVVNKPVKEAAEFMMGRMEQDFHKKYGFAYHLAHRSLFKGYYEEFSEQVLTYFRRTGVGIRTVEANIFVKTQNIINNLTALSVNIDELLLRLKGRPAIMVSAGPSLDKNIHLLEKAKEKAFVIAVGSAIKILYNKGIRPHARAAFSPHPDENTVFDGIADFEGIPLVYSNTLDYLVVKNYDAPKARMVMDSDPITRYLYEQGGISHTLVGSGGTIANVTFDLLCRAGCSQVIFTGQDMCYTDLKLYADGSWSDPRIAAASQGLIKEKNIYGEEVFTSAAFAGIRQDLETALARYPQLTFWNATEGGLTIAGAPAKPLQEVLDAIAEPFAFDAMLQEVFFQQEEKSSESAALAAAMDKTLADVRQIIEINDRRTAAIDTAVGDGKNNYRILRELDKLQSFEAELAQVPFYQAVVQFEIATPLTVIQKAYQYSGDDAVKKVWSRLSTLRGTAAKLGEYAGFVNEMLSQQVREEN